MTICSGPGCHLPPSRDSEFFCSIFCFEAYQQQINATTPVEYGPSQIPSLAAEEQDAKETAKRAYQVHRAANQQLREEAGE